MEMGVIMNHENALPRFVPGMVVAALAIALSTGCTVQTDSGPPPPVVAPAGNLILQWTLDEGTDPNVCIQSGASTLDVTITTTDSRIAGEFQAACTQFQTSISQLGPGSYVADAVLLDGSGAARTTTININPFTLGASDLVITVDFPANSFF
jgi:hypothetical protein